MNRCIYSLVVVLLVLLTGVRAAAEDSASAIVPTSSSADEDVTIIDGQARTVYEYRRAGQLRMIRVVPKFGRPYFLVPADPTRGNGDLEQRGQLVPSWRILEF